MLIAFSKKIIHTMENSDPMIATNQVNITIKASGTIVKHFTRNSSLLL